MTTKVSNFLFNPNATPATGTAAGNGAAIRWGGGPGSLFAKGTWGGTSFKMEYSPDGTDWYATDSTSVLTANGMYNFECPAGYIRGVLTGGTGMSVKAYVRQY